MTKFSIELATNSITKTRILAFLFFKLKFKTHKYFLK